MSDDPLVDTRNLPFLIAKRNDDVSFVLFANGAIRRVTGSTEIVVLNQEYNVPIRDISGGEHDVMANISKALFNY
jgi:hypothetical protein